VRIALDLDPRVPAVLCDARKRDSVKQILITLVEHVLASRVKDEEDNTEEDDTETESPFQAAPLPEAVPDPAISQA